MRGHSARRELRTRALELLLQRRLSSPLGLRAPHFLQPVLVSLAQRRLDPLTLGLRVAPSTAARRDQRSLLLEELLVQTLELRVPRLERLASRVRLVQQPDELFLRHRRKGLGRGCGVECCCRRQRRRTGADRLWLRGGSRRQWRRRLLRRGRIWSAVDGRLAPGAVLALALSCWCRR